MNSSRVGAILLLCCSATASSQIVQATVAPAVSSCIDHLPPSVFKRVAVYAYVDLQDSASIPFAQSADNFLQEVVNTVQRQLGSPEGKLPVGEPAVNWRGTDTPLHLVAHKDGRIVVDRDSLGVATAAAASLVARAIDSITMFGQLEWSADSARDSVRFDIAFVRPVIDSAGHVGMPSHARDAVLVLSVLAPWERSVAMKPGQTPLHYPRGALNDRYEASILLTFIVDSAGHTVASTIHDLWPKEKPRPTGRDSAAYQSFLDETERAVVKIDFNPAEIGGCRVPQLVRMPFVYSINR